MDEATKKIAKAKPCAQIDLLYWMSNHPTIANTELITPLLASENAEVVEAAAWALTRIYKWKQYLVRSEQTSEQVLKAPVS